MTATERAAVRGFLERNGLQALRQLGQNYLVDESLAERLVVLAGVESGDAVVEIGTGLGQLTNALARRACRVVSIEVDAGLVRALRAEGSLRENVELIHADALKVDLRRTALDVGSSGRPVRIVANLPYSISAPLLRRFLDLRDVIVDWSVMVQREVAGRLLAAAGTRAYGSLSVLHRVCVEPSRVLDLKPGCFQPVPKVRSAFLRMVPLAEPLVGVDDAGTLGTIEALLRGAFSSRRKTLANSLRSSTVTAFGSDQVDRALRQLDLDPMVRAEALTPSQFVALAAALAGTPG